MTDESNVLTMRSDEFLNENDTVTYTACSSVGGRTSQQDSLFVAEKDNSILAVVCDGMGGMDGGEKASELAIRLLAEAYYSQDIPSVPQFYHDMAIKLDDAVYNLESDGKRLGAGTTIVSVLLCPAGLYWLSVGDSKIYLYRKGAMLCPVPAHNYRLLLDQMLALGKIDQEKYINEEKKAEALISFLGLGGISRMEINQNPFQLEPKDQILLCSDGLYKSLSDEQILDVLNMRISLEIKAKILLEKALEIGGSRQDNTSIVLLQV